MPEIGLFFHVPHDHGRVVEMTAEVVGLTASWIVGRGLLMPVLGHRRRVEAPGDVAVLLHLGVLLHLFHVLLVRHAGRHGRVLCGDSEREGEREPERRGGQHAW